MKIQFETLSEINSELETIPATVLTAHCFCSHKYNLRCNDFKKVVLVAHVLITNL
jgi:hypothetical protein